MIKISFKLLLAISIVSSNVIADDFKAKAKFKPQYPKSAYVKRISGYAIVEFVINENGRTENQSILSAKCFNLIDKNGAYFWYDFPLQKASKQHVLFDTILGLFLEAFPIPEDLDFRALPHTRLHF